MDCYWLYVHPTHPSVQILKDSAGALIYYIRRCLHDWPDADCILMLQNVAAAMTPNRSRLLIAEIVVPESGPDPEAAWMDITMMTFAGQERSEKQWRALLEEAGMELRRTLLAEGTNWGVVEAWLK